MPYSPLLDLAHIVIAIQLSAPGLNYRTTEYYAKTIYRETTKKNIDPLLVIAIAEHESRWDASKISADKEDRGLLQIRARYVHQSRPYLLEGGTNLRVGISLLDSDREFCEKQLGREVKTEEYLSCFQGSCGRPKHRCQPTKMTARVEAYTECLRSALIDNVSRDCEILYITMPKR